MPEPIVMEPLPQTVADAVPEMSKELSDLLTIPDIASLKYLNACICATCAFNPDIQFACARQAYCCGCMESKAACNCFKLVEAPYCVNASACFCLKCIACSDEALCCDFPFPIKSKRLCMCCNWDEQKTVCGGGAAGRSICCSNSAHFSCLNPVEKFCFMADRLFCIDCRLGCAPGAYPEIPMTCTVFGAQLWAK